MSTAATLTRRDWLKLAGLLTCVGLFYVWTAFTCTFSPRPAPDLQYFYNHLSRAFMAGQTSLLIQPSPQLLALADPYDPATNGLLRLHDAVLFHGKYYLYYGPVPAIGLFIPFRLLTHLDLPEPVAVATFCTIGLIYSFLLLVWLCKAYIPDTPFWLLMSAILALGFGNVTPFMLRRPVHYEVAIAGGFAFAFAGIYYFVTGMLGPRLRLGLVALGSLCVGLAGGSRFPMFAAGFVGLVLALFVIWQRRDRPWREQVWTLLALGGPAAVCLFLLLFYNYVRFGAWGEFGMRYTLQGYQSARTYVFFSLARAPMGFFYYVLVPPRIEPQFPFIFAEPGYFAAPPHDYWLERTAGILPTVPLLGMLLLAPAFWPTWRRRLPLSLVAGAMAVVGAVLLFLVCCAAATMRYEVDFATFFLIPALLLWCLAVTRFPPGDWRRRLVGTTFSVLLVSTVIVGAALSISGYYEDLKYGHPVTFLFLSDLFAPVRYVFFGLR
jgi:hypothetical protein